MFDPASENYWRGVPLAVEMVIAITTRADVVGKAASVVLPPMREKWDDTDARVAEFVSDTDTLEAALGGRDAILAMAKVELRERTDAVERAHTWLLCVRDAADDLAARKGPADPDLARLGMQLQEALGDLGEKVAFHDVIRVMPGVMRIVEPNAQRLVGKGFTTESLAEGRALLTEVTVDGGEASGSVTMHEQLTVELQRKVARIVDFFMMWARRRRLLQRTMKEPLPGWNLAVVEQWRATRPAAVAARAEARAEAAQATTTTPPAAPTGGVISDALATFRGTT